MLQNSRLRKALQDELSGQEQNNDMRRAVSDTACKRELEHLSELSDNDSDQSEDEKDSDKVKQLTSNRRCS
jgi:hypothetical protein